MRAIIMISSELRFLTDTTQNSLCLNMCLYIHARAYYRNIIQSAVFLMYIMLAQTLMQYGTTRHIR